MKLHEENGMLRLGDVYIKNIYANLSTDQSKIAIFNDVNNQNLTSGSQLPSYFEDENDNSYTNISEILLVLAPFISAPAGSSERKPLDEILSDDIDWNASDFTGWDGDPVDLFGNVNTNLGITNDSLDNPKTFILRLKRTKKMRDFGIGASIGNWSNLKATLLGSGDKERGILDLSEDIGKENSWVYSKEEFTFNAIKVEFLTSDTITLTNLFFKYTSSDRKQGYVLKFGRNPEIDTGGDEAIWTIGGPYVFTTVPQPYFISSSDLNDTQEISGELVVIDNDGRYRQVLYSVNLQGQNKVQIPVPNNWDVIASNRAFNNNGTPLEGDVFIYEDTAINVGIPTDLTKVRSHIDLGREQTEQAVYTIPEYLETGQKIAFAELYQWESSVINDKTTSAKVDLRVAEKGKVALIKGTRSLSNNFPAVENFGRDTPLQIPPASDVYLQAYAFTANDVEIEGNFIINPIAL